MPIDIRITNSKIKGDAISIGDHPTSIHIQGDKSSVRINNTAFTELSKELLANGISYDDISDLCSAISRDADTGNVLPNKPGPNVKKWIKNMLGKAVDAVWQIELGMAGSLLASAISRYYGWP
jgi:hypothetical protein